MKYGIGLKDASEFLRSEYWGHSGGCGTLLGVIPVKHLVFALFIVEGLSKRGFRRGVDTRGPDNCRVPCNLGDLCRLRLA
jgi:hypothetical protein